MLPHLKKKCKRRPPSWMPPAPTMTMPMTLITDVVEVAFTTRKPVRLVGAIELVSPANKDRAATRDAFASKCASYLQQAIDDRCGFGDRSRADLHADLLRRLNDTAVPPTSDLWAASYRPCKPARIQTWKSGTTRGHRRRFADVAILVQERLVHQARPGCDLHAHLQDQRMLAAGAGAPSGLFRRERVAYQFVECDWASLVHRQGLQKTENWQLAHLSNQGASRCRNPKVRRFAWRRNCSSRWMLLARRQLSIGRPDLSLRQSAAEAAADARGCEDMLLGHWARPPDRIYLRTLEPSHQKVRLDMIYVRPRARRPGRRGQYLPRRHVQRDLSQRQPG